jgi:hypothetical protein
MWLYNRKWWKFKWKDSKTSNDKTQVQVDADEVRIREGIKLRWSQGFGLNELDAWQECWWLVNLWLVNWCPQMGQKILSGSYERVEKIGVGWGSDHGQL